MIKISRRKFVTALVFAIFAGGSIVKKFFSGGNSVICAAKIPFYPGKIKEKGNFSEPGNNLAG